jgi:hypothetical protein
MAAVANVAARERSAVLSEWNGTMLNTISNSPSVFLPVKTLWRRLVDNLANRLEERRARAELALMTPRERFDLDVAYGNLAWSTLARTARRGDTNLNVIKLEDVKVFIEQHGD